MNRNPHDAVPRWRRRLALIAGACGLFLLNLAFVALPVAADGHSGDRGGHHDGQGVEAEHHGADMDANHHVNHDVDNDANDDRGQDVNKDADDRAKDADNDDVNDDRDNDPQADVNDNRDNDDAPMTVMVPMTTTTSDGR